MRGNEYQEAALRTAGAADPAVNEDRFVYTALGLAGEAGELQELTQSLSIHAGKIADLTKKTIYHKHEYTPEKFLDELGDVLWYLAINAHTHGYTLEEVMVHNIEKLNKRYPNGFSHEESRNRKQ